jgi:Family of unknown function (DUF5996)
MERDSSSAPGAAASVWPALPLDAWRDTYATLHMWTQIVGKVRLALSPPVNHWWHVALYVTARGLTTSPMPYGTRTFAGASWCRPTACSISSAGAISASAARSTSSGAASTWR